MKKMWSSPWRAVWSISMMLGACASSQDGLRQSMLEQLAREQSLHDDARGEAPELGAPLRRDAVVRAVLVRNPDIGAALHAWRATLEREAQRDVLPDPRVEYTFAPLSIGNADVRYGQIITVRQDFPFPGQLSLRGAVVLAEAAAARDDYQTVRLELALMASRLYDRLYALERALEINTEHQTLVRDVRAVTLDQLAAGRATQAEPLRAELELHRVELDRVRLVAEREVVVARLNGLLHRRPESALPPTPARIEVEAGSPLPSTEDLQTLALAARSELHAAERRIEAREAARDVASSERRPDFGVMASYNSMWQQVAHQLMVGVSVVVPLHFAAARAAVREQESLTEVERARRETLVDRVRVEVQEARANIERARESLRLLATQMLPTARDQLDAAHAAYVSGRGPLEALIDAERSVRTLTLEVLWAEAEVKGARVDLVRATGGVAGIDELPGENR